MRAMPKVAESTVRRLSLYLRFLEEFEGQGIATVSSARSPRGAGRRPRRCGRTCRSSGRSASAGLGYPVPELADQLREILGLKRRYRVAMIGAGKIGSALVQYRGFRQRGFDIVAIFDSDPAKIGRQWNGLTVIDIAHLERGLASSRRHGGAGDPGGGGAGGGRPAGRLGVKAILNFARSSWPCRTTSW